jgi:hypothetical protein
MQQCPSGFERYSDSLRIEMTYSRKFDLEAIQTQKDLWQPLQFFGRARPLT